MAMFDPAHPGELIREIIEGLRQKTGEKLTIEEVAQGLGITRKTLSAILNGRQGITTGMALTLAVAFDTTPEFWLRAQENYDLAGPEKNWTLRTFVYSGEARPHCKHTQTAPNNKLDRN